MKYECSCDICELKFEDKSLTIKDIKGDIVRVKGLNKPFTRSGRVFGNILHFIDSSIGIISLGYLCSNFGSEFIIRDLHKFAQYDESHGDDFKYRLYQFRFKIFKWGKISKPSTRSRKVLGHILRMLDSIIGIITFGNYDSFISHELTSRELNRLGRFITRFGVEFKKGEKTVEDKDQISSLENAKE